MLCVCDCVQGQCCFIGGFWVVDFDDMIMWEFFDVECDVEGDGVGWDDGYRGVFIVVQLYD